MDRRLKTITIVLWNLPVSVFALELSASFEERGGAAPQPLPTPTPPVLSSPPPPPSSMEDSGGCPLFSSTLWSCWQRNLGGTSLDMYRCCWGVWFPEREEGCPLATAVRCFALFPPPGGTGAENPVALEFGDEGSIGPGQGETEVGVVGCWEQEGLVDSGTGTIKRTSG